MCQISGICEGDGKLCRYFGCELGFPAQSVFRKTNLSTGIPHSIILDWKTHFIAKWSVSITLGYTFITGSFLYILEHILVFSTLMLNLYNSCPCKSSPYLFFLSQSQSPSGALPSQSTPIHSLTRWNFTSSPQSLLKQLCLIGIPDTQFLFSWLVFLWSDRRS